MGEARVIEHALEHLAALAAMAETAAPGAVPGTEDDRPAAGASGATARAPAVGADLVRISRLGLAVNRWGESFLGHIFTEEEISFCRSKHDPLPHFAGTLAAKEAVYKALGMRWYRAFSWRMIEITRDDAGRPRVRSSRYASNRVCRELDGMGVSVSISHEDDYTIAVAVAHPGRSDQCE
ncbi:MAG: holo-[acyl-carrier-protein] synthase [Spirochaetes bacterium]|jgi:holo-[acyl-carrier-protein] synthase|nr:holo-[acyl-carrier-protein] synthase [Spirochaetota bacterium]